MPPRSCKHEESFSTTSMHPNTTAGKEDSCPSPLPLSHTFTLGVCIVDEMHVWGRHPLRGVHGMAPCPFSFIALLSTDCLDAEWYGSRTSLHKSLLSDLCHTRAIQWCCLSFARRFCPEALCKVDKSLNASIGGT